MDADDLHVKVVLQESTRFMVPLYQRKYQWGDNRLEPFWQDVEAKAQEVLNNESKFDHYMGALILAPIDDRGKIAVTPSVQVVDGQQRLTTFQLLLVAIREVAREHDCPSIIESVEDYIFNKPKNKDTDPLTKFKLTPTPSDRDLFHFILENEYPEVRLKYHKYYYGGRVPKNTPYKALRSYQLFIDWIQRFVLYGTTDTAELNEELNIANGNEIENNIIEERFEALLNAILERLKLVVITLGEDDDAQVIFETLNSKGEPLLAMDLVRNNIFYRAEKQGASAEELYKELWDPFDNAWWRDNAPNARPKRPRIDHFLSHVLAAESGEKISMRELYAEYRAFVSPEGKLRYENVEDELRLLESYAPVYETLEGRSADSHEILAWLGRKLATWQVTTAYPIAMQIAKNDVPDDERIKIAKLIYSYIVRRAVCGLTAKNMNKVFQGLSLEFVRQGISLSTFEKFFSDKTGESSRFPTDEQFKAGILSQPVYQLAPGNRVKDILWELEEIARSHFAEKSLMPEKLQTEHVLPISWNEDWPFIDGEWEHRHSEFPKAVRRNQVLHTLGNLTLITGGLNSSSSNRSFAEKKEKFEEHTALFLNKWFSKHSVWNEEKIQERGRHFAELAPKIWIGLN